MSPRYNYDPSKVTTSIEVFPKDDYEFIVGEPKSFIRKNKKGEDSFGVRFALTVAEGDLRGKKTVYTAYLHSEGAQSMTKRFQMAVFGFGQTPQVPMKVAEANFNAQFGDADWGFDPETGTVAEGWQKMAGSRVIGTLDVGKNPETDEPTQTFKSWRPAITVAA